ncbi:MAG: hypothetical protein AAGA16_07520 [Cyanobacteria bacterium P01_E01_bin.35]
MNQYQAKSNTKEPRIPASREITSAFKQLLEQYQQSSCQIATREEEAEKKKHQELLSKTNDYSVDNIVSEMASLRLSFGNSISQLTTELSNESNKLNELRTAIAVEQENLQRLNQIRLVADALHILKQEHQAITANLQAQTARVKETITQEIAETKRQWLTEEAEFTVKIQEAAELLTNNRILEEADYQYELERQRTVEQDEYESDLRLQNRELSELEQEKNKDWSERERYLSKHKSKFAKNQEKIAGFEAQLQEEYNKAIGKAIKEADSKYKVAADLQDREWSATQQGYELKIASLTTVVENQTVQISEIMLQLQEANLQGQNLAIQAFQNTAN